MSAYHGFARLGTERIPEPRVWEDFPPFHIDGFSLVAWDVDDSSVIIECKVHLVDCAELSRYRLLGKIQIVEPGRGSNPGLMRTFLAEDVGTVGSNVKICRFTVPTSVVGERLQLHSRMLLLDSTSGYRSQYQKYSKVL